MHETDIRQPSPRVLALAFVGALVVGDFEGAHRMLAPEIRDKLSPSDLKSEFEWMYSYAGDTTVDDFNVASVDDPWTDKEDGDVASVFVGITGTNREYGWIWNEAMDLLFSEVEGRLQIRDIIWGRP